VLPEQPVSTIALADPCFVKGESVDGSGIDRPRPEDDERQKFQDRIADLEAQLAVAQRLAATGIAASMAVHEFRNIFTPLVNFARMAVKGNERATAKTIQLASDGAPRAEAICEALLDFAGGDATKRETVKVVDLVDETLAAMGRDLAKDGIRLVKRVPPRLEINTRPIEIKQVLLNLLLNARDAVLGKGSGRSIEIKALKRDGKVLVRVGDTGVGVAPADQERIFEPFFTTGKDHGCGLGLAVCRQIAENHHGTLAFRSQHGKGTWFTLTLPTKIASTRRKRKPTVAAKSA